MKNTVVFITGFSAAGKTTLSNSLFKFISDKHPDVKVLQVDGDELRKERPTLGFSEQERFSNVYHGTYKAITHSNYNNGIAIISLIAPLQDMRKHSRRLVETYSNATFVEVFLDTPLEVCEQRDPKGLYKKARAGEIKNFTGIDNVYERPENPDVWLPQRNPFYGELTVDICTKMVYDHIINL